MGSLGARALGDLVGSDSVTHTALPVADIDTGGVASRHRSSQVYAQEAARSSWTGRLRSSPPCANEDERELCVILRSP